jgi:hypothetical protein
MKVKIATILILSSLVVSSALTQETSKVQVPLKPQEIQGTGTANHLTKFTGSRTVGNSAVIETGASLRTDENLTVGGVASSVSGISSIAVRGTNNTTDGSTDEDAFYGSGLIGILGETSSPAGAALEGMAYASSGDPVGVFGKTVSVDRGIGVRGQAVGGSGRGIGVLGEANSENGFGMIAVNAASGNPIGIFGYVVSPDAGVAILGRTMANTGFGIGVTGETFSPNGFGGSFTNTAGGNILRGVNNSTVVFRVDGNGTVFATGGFQPSGADFAESMAVSGDRSKYVAGDVLVIDSSSDRRLALAQVPYSTLVAGIYSTKPGMLGSVHKVDQPRSKEEIPLAVVGIVPCKVSSENGAIQPGDLLVTSSTVGYAMKGTDRNRMLGAVVGKALEPLASEVGVIQVLVTLQ